MAMRIRSVSEFIKGASAFVLAAFASGCATVEDAPIFASFSAASVAEAAENAPRPEPVAPQDRTRKATVAQIPFNVAIWMRRDAERQFMVQREDLQPMFLADWSQGRAESAIIATYGKGECADDMALMLEKAIWDPTGVWVIDGACRDVAMVLASLRPFPKLRPVR